MCNALPNNVIEFRVPADRSMMLVIRLATAGVLTRAQLTVDAIDDVKMAVEEACMLMISQECPPPRLVLQFIPKEKAIDIHVHADADAPCICSMDASEIEIIQVILESLVDAAEIDANGTIRNIHLTKAL